MILTHCLKLLQEEEEGAAQKQSTSWRQRQKQKQTKGGDQDSGSKQAASTAPQSGTGSDVGTAAAVDQNSSSSQGDGVSAAACGLGAGPDRGVNRMSVGCIGGQHSTSFSESNARAAAGAEAVWGRAGVEVGIQLGGPQGLYAAANSRDQEKTEVNPIHTAEGPQVAQAAATERAASASEAAPAAAAAGSSSSVEGFCGLQTCTEAAEAAQQPSAGSSIIHAAHAPARAAVAVAAASTSLPGKRRKAKGVECVVCLDAKAEVMLLPCKHIILCWGCSQLLEAAGKPCPICCAPVEQHVGVAAAAAERAAGAAAGTPMTVEATQGAAATSASSAETATPPGAGNSGAAADDGSSSSGSPGVSVKDNGSSSTGWSDPVKVNNSSSSTSTWSRGTDAANLTSSSSRSNGVSAAVDVNNNSSRSSSNASTTVIVRSSNVDSTSDGSKAGGRVGGVALGWAGEGSGVAAPAVAAGAQQTEPGAHPVSGSGDSSKELLHPCNSQQSCGYGSLLEHGSCLGAVASTLGVAGADAHGVKGDPDEEQGTVLGEGQQGRSNAAGSSSAGLTILGSQPRQEGQQWQQQQQLACREFVREAAGLVEEARGEVMSVLDKTMGQLKELCLRYGVPAADVLP